MTTAAGVPGYSLQSRLLLVFSLMLFLFLGMIGVVLEPAFRTSVEAGAADRLQVQIYLLLAAVEEQDGEFYFLQDLQEPLFNQLNSGLYGFISSAGLGELWRSDSARTFTVPDGAFLQESVPIGETTFAVIPGEAATYFRLSYGILWEDGITELSFSVIEDAAPYYSEIANFRRSLWSWLGGAAVVLLTMQLLLLRWGLSPLGRMAADLIRIESGEREKLAEDYPRELQGVATNLNMLIETERRQQKRYRTTLGDLAHSLKTPLAVVSGLLPQLRDSHESEDKMDTDDKLDTVNEQLDRMSQIVSYQLQRAVQSNNSGSLARQIKIHLMVKQVVGALQKVYAEKSMQIETSLEESAVFNGDERDLLELLGNILDNAFKYGSSRIGITVAKLPNARSIEIVVEDDGAGVPETKVEFVLQRGARADTLAQGQGIGLAVVSDIVHSYNGSIQIENSRLGGALVRLQFPSI